MMKILDFANMNSGLLVIILLLCVLAAVFLGLYTRERCIRKETEASVSGEREFYQAFGYNRRDFYLLIRMGDLRVLYMSPNFESMTGIPAELVYADIEVLKEALPRRAARDIERQLKEWDQADTLKFEFDYAADGDETARRGRGILTPMQEEKRYLAVFSDITEEFASRQAIEEELIQSKQEGQAKTDFLSKMSHEIRTPMNGVLGMLSLAKSHIYNPAQAEEYLEKAESLSQFLLTLINDILDMSRIESGKMELEQAVFDLFGLADKLNSMFKNTVEGKGVRWILEMQDFDVRYVVGDELRLSQVIVNFISNANKFTPEGGTVSVTFRQMSKIEGNLHLMVRVRDTGRGMRQDFLSRIFRPFEQEDASTARNYGGSGLGMAIADNIVKLMQGQIIVDSELGKGSEFVIYVTLPIAGDAQVFPDASEFADMSGEDEERKRAIEAFTLEGVHLLLAEDNDINAEIAIDIMEMEGAVLERACDGLEALQMFKDSEPGRYDAILMDIQMPNMDGWEATQEIRKLDREDADIPIFAMSANAFVEDKRHSAEVGMDGHISKPVDYDEVRRVIAEHIC